MNRFKFQSITADDTLGFFLEYFPELKEKGVDSIPGQYSTILARERGCHLTTPHPRVSELQCHPEPLHVDLCVLLEMLEAGMALTSWDQAQAWACTSLV